MANLEPKTSHMEYANTLFLFKSQSQRIYYLRYKVVSTSSGGKVVLHIIEGKKKACRHSRGIVKREMRREVVQCLLGTASKVQIFLSIQAPFVP